MATATLTTKGQVTIPVEIRNQLGLKAGDRIDFERNALTGVIEIRRKTGRLADLCGMLKYSGPSVSIEDMDRAIGEHLAGDDARIQREWRERS